MGILADETSWLAEAIPEYQFWLDDDILDKIEAIVHHSYDNPSDFGYAAFRDDLEATYPGKPRWMTVSCRHIPKSLYSAHVPSQEICCATGPADGSDRAYGAGYDPTYVNISLNCLSSCPSDKTHAVDCSIVNALMWSYTIFQVFLVGHEPHYDVCPPYHSLTCHNIHIRLSSGPWLRQSLAAHQRKILNAPIKRMIKVGL